MRDWVESGPRPPVRGRSSGGRSFGGWRIDVSAWLIVIALGVLLIGAHALASRTSIVPRHGSLAGAVIPRHDPGITGPDEVAASDWLERAKVDANTGW
jgi:hypothetical protein